MKKIKIPITTAECDFCGKQAKYDAPTIYRGPWAYMCEKCFSEFKGSAAETIGFILH